jgi:hypothetical protein
VIWLLACAGAEPEPYVGCNGHEELCDRSFLETAALRSHNSHASWDRGYHPAAANHYLAIPDQLKDGVRSLNVDVYEWEGEVVACHGFCELGLQPFDEILDEIDTFLGAHEREVVQLDFQDETPDGVLVEALAAHPLSERAAVFEAWPTLGALIEEHEQVLILGSPREGDPDWLLPRGELVYGTHWQYDTPEELECVVSGEAFEGGLYEVTHVLTNPIASPDNAELINHDPVLSEHIDRCVAEVGFVNLVSIDYYSIGDGLKLIDRLNGVSD